MLSPGTRISVCFGTLFGFPDKRTAGHLIDEIRRLLHTHYGPEYRALICEIEFSLDLAAAPELQEMAIRYVEELEDPPGDWDAFTVSAAVEYLKTLLEDPEDTPCVFPRKT